ncbi:MAG: DegT/DnrJ/EryC1/StrS family aminotransferase [Cyanobacteriota bacterium]|nr:DegT/DnrJ/EryC1/StrS family aminotransferase [Cyanobacteriota bacterium]
MPSTFSANANEDPYGFPRQELLRDGHLLLEALERMRASGEVILGAGVSRFEEAFSQWLTTSEGGSEVVGVANGTDALELALRGCGLSVGDGVLLPAHTAYATLAAVLRVGAKPIFVDVDPGSPLLSTQHLEERLLGSNPKPKALIVVHLYGAACDLDGIETLCQVHGVDLIEDCAQACGTTYQGRPVGTRGRFSAFSFYPTKNLAAFGDGGALVVNRAEDRLVARRSRFYGWDGQKTAVQFGINSRLDELQAWVLLGKLARLDGQIARRRQVASWYHDRLHTLLKVPEDGQHWHHSYHLYVVEMAPAWRDALLSAGFGKALPLGVHYPLACHQHPYIQQLVPEIPPLPRTESLVKRILSLPLNPYMEEHHVEHICQMVKPFLEGDA